MKYNRLGTSGLFVSELSFGTMTFGEMEGQPTLGGLTQQDASAMVAKAFEAGVNLFDARFLWRHIDYAIFIIFIIAAVLTPTTDPWNQTVFAAPMIGLYLISIGIAWLVGPRRENETSNESHSNNLRLVFAATVIDHARRRRKRLPGELPRNWRASV